MWYIAMWCDDMVCFVLLYVHIYIHICTIQLTWYSLTGSSILGIIWVYSWILLVLLRPPQVGFWRVGIVEIWVLVSSELPSCKDFSIFLGVAVFPFLFSIYVFQLSEFTNVRKRPWSKTVSKLQKCFSVAFRVSFILKPPKPPNGTWPQIMSIPKKNQQKNMIELLDKLGWYVFFLMSLFDTPHHRHPQETVGVCAWQPLWCRRHHRHLGLHGLEAQDMEEGDTPGTPKPPCATQILVMAAIGTMVFHGLSTSFMVFHGLSIPLLHQNPRCWYHRI